MYNIHVYICVCEISVPEHHRPQKLLKDVMYILWCVPLTFDPLPLYLCCQAAWNGRCCVLTLLLDHGADASLQVTHPLICPLDLLWLGENNFWERMGKKMSVAVLEKAAASHASGLLISPLVSSDVCMCLVSIGVLGGG